MAQTNIAISVNGLEKAYKNLKVLKKINFSVQRGIYLPYELQWLLSAHDLLDEFNASLNLENQTLSIATDGSYFRIDNITN